MEMHPDRIRYITLTQEEADGINEVMREALPKCRDWPRYGRYGEIMLSAAQKTSSDMTGTDAVEFIGMGYHPDEMNPDTDVDRRLAA